MALRLLAVLVVLQLAAAAKKEDPNDCEGACTPTAGWRSAARTPQQRCRIRGCAASSVPHMPLLLLHLHLLPVATSQADACAAARLPLPSCPAATCLCIG
jgi:hypothetical protein